MLMQLRQWFTAAELEGLKLKGLPRSKREINKRARAERWDIAADDKGHPLARRRNGRGGGLEYHCSLFPASARADLAHRGMGPQPASFADVDAGDEPSKAAEQWQWLAQQSEAVRAEAHKRAAIIARIETLELSGMTRSAAVFEVASHDGIGVSTLWSWLALVEGIAAADRLPCLAPRRQGGGKECDIDAEIWQALLSDYLRPSQPSWATCYRDLLEGLTGKRSAKDLSDAEQRKVLGRMRELGFGTKGKATGLTGPFAPKLLALWLSAWNLGITRSNHDNALIAFVERQTGIAHLSWLRDPRDAAKAIDGLKIWITREAGVEWPKGTRANPRETKLAVIVAQWRMLGLGILPEHIELARTRNRIGDQTLDQAIASYGAAIRKAKA